ncbi:14298_t:CDS:1, partial [Entrophospora sp. SA101]
YVHSRIGSNILKSSRSKPSLDELSLKIRKMVIGRGCQICTHYSSFLALKIQTNFLILKLNNRVEQKVDRLLVQQLPGDLIDSTGRDHCPCHEDNNWDCIG